MQHAYANGVKTFAMPSGQGGHLCSLPALAEMFPNIWHLLVSMRIVLESVPCASHGPMAQPGT